MIAESLRTLTSGQSLTAEEMYTLFAQMMDGHVSDVQKSALLVALRMKGESVAEITGAARAMRERVVPITTTREDLVDTCGTGGDGRGTFNVSTVAAFVAAGAGVAIAKHGNRAVSSACGSADLLAALGVNVDLQAGRISEILDEIGISFLFAPRLHPAMAAVAGVRKELGLRTIFNVLGPLTNPALAGRQVLGVYAPSLVRPVAQALAELGSTHVLVVHSEDGLDEISISAPTLVAELRWGQVLERVIDAAELGLTPYPLDEVGGGDVDANVEIAHSVLAGLEGAAREIVLANAGAAIYVSGLAETLIEGVSRARASIDSGAARTKLDELIAATNRGAAE